MPAPTREELVAFAHGKLSQQQVEDVAARLEQYPASLAELQTISGVADSMLESIRQAIPAARYAGEHEFQRAMKKVTGMISGEETVDVSSRQDATFVPSGSPAEESAAPRQLRDYRLHEKLGEGGMGAVYKAVHERLEKTVALKILPAERLKDPQVVARFHREMKAVGRLDHPNIIRATDAGEELGTHYLVMDFVDGEDVARLVERQDKLSIADACEIIRQAAVGLQHAHEHNLVHRDIKPANMLLTRQGVVKLLDLGLARLHEEGPVADGSELTSDGQLMGTVDYIAPEQAADTRTADIRADIYSLGCSLYKLLTGKPPFAGDNFQTPVQKIMAHTMTAPPSLAKLRPDLPPGLLPIVDRMIAKDREQRYATPGDLASAITPFCAGADLARAANGDMPSAVSHPELRTSSMRQPSFLSPPPTRRRVALLSAAAAAFLVVAFLVFRIATDHGEIVITTSDDNVEVTVRHVGQQGGEDLELTKGDNQTKVRSGEVEIVIRGDNADQYNVSPNKVTLRRGEKEVVKIERKVTAAPTAENSLSNDVPPSTRLPAADSNSASLADREKPFVVVRAEGIAPVACSTLARAAEIAHDADTIEIHGNGPFRTGGVHIKATSLTILAAPGYRPRFRTTDAQHMIAVENCDLTVSGCDFRGTHFGYHAFFVGNGPKWTFRNCRFLAETCFPVVYRGTRLTLADCLITTNNGIFSSGWIEATNNKLQLEVANCILRVPHRELFPLPPYSDWDVVLRGNTITVYGTFLTSMAGREDARLKVWASGNIFELNQANGNDVTRAELHTWTDRVEWQGDHNLYVAPLLYTAPQNTLIWNKDAEGKQVTYGLAGWEEFWGRKEEGSLEVKSYYPAWRAPFAVDEPDALRESVRSVVDARRGLVRADSQPVGPDWQLVGPGPAYVRALAAQGQPVPSESARPKPIEGAPFIVLRNGQETSAHDDLGKAFAAADQDGDVVEIRTDDGVPAAAMPSPMAPRRLTIRAAVGYLPVIEGHAQWLQPNLTLSVEGLHFRSGGLDLVDYAQVERGCRLARLANCSFGNPGDHVAGFHHYAVGNPWVGFQTPDGQPTEIINCLMHGAIAVILDPGSRLILRNSVVGPLTTVEPVDVEGEQNIEIERSLLWCPATFSGPAGNLWSGQMGDGKPLGTWTVTLRHSLVESPKRLFPTGPLPRWTRFTGEGNIYATCEQTWYVADGQAADFPTIASLREWRSHWKSDVDSVQTDPLIYDPEQWRLLPGTPGQGTGPEGRDYGADVDQLIQSPSKTPQAE